MSDTKTEPLRAPLHHDGILTVRDSVPDLTFAALLYFNTLKFFDKRSFAA